jgi:bidirectional [NiFe] hydrogenase diaphorase subunit
MHDLLVKIVDRKATAQDLVHLEDLCGLLRETSLCGLGQSAPNPVCSTLNYFRDEYLERLIPQEDGEGTS